MKHSLVFLSGGGDVDQSTALDKIFFDVLPINSKLLYIPVALQRTAIGYEMCFDWFADLVTRYNNDRDLDFTMLLENDPMPNLDDFDAVYIGGGNTYKLLRYLEVSGMGVNLKRFIEKDKVVYGGSAGAIVFGRDIRTVESENTIQYANFQGLDLIGGASVLCHYEERQQQDARNIASAIGGPIFCIPENAGVVFDYKNQSYYFVNKVKLIK